MLTTFLTPNGPFDRPHLLHTLLTQPLHLLIRLASHFLTILRPLPFSTQRQARKIRIVCISDTHSLDPGPIPPGDILIHSGDITAHGTPSELQTAVDHLSTLPHPHKFIIAGNHDTYLDPNSRQTLSEADQNPPKPLDWKNLTYLQHTSATITIPSKPSGGGHNSQQPAQTLHIHGSPPNPPPQPNLRLHLPPQPRRLDINHPARNRHPNNPLPALHPPRPPPRNGLLPPLHRSRANQTPPPARLRARPRRAQRFRRLASGRADEGCVGCGGEGEV